MPFKKFMHVDNLPARNIASTNKEKLPEEMG
jgi:hypothetical protein